MKLREYIDWKFVLMWAGAIFISYLLMGLLSILRDNWSILIMDWFTASFGPVTGILLQRTLRFAFGGALLGFAQWLLLRNRLNQAGWWIAILAFISALQGCWLTYGLLQLNNTPGGPEPLLEITIALSIAVNVSIVLLQGVLQWLVLYQRAYKRGIWIITVLAEYGLDIIVQFVPLLPVSFLAGGSYVFASHLLSIESALHQGLIGLLTGAVMSWMLNHPFDDPEPTPAEIDQ